MHEINVLTNWTILASILSNTLFHTRNALNLLSLMHICLYLKVQGWIPWIEQGTYCATYSCSTYWTIPTLFTISCLMSFKEKVLFFSYAKNAYYLKVYSFLRRGESNTQHWIPKIHDFTYLSTPNVKKSF